MRERRIAAQPGGWITVQVPENSFPATFTVGSGDPQPAFIEHTTERGTISEWAKIRCPQLPNGSYPLRVRTPHGDIHAQLRVGTA